MLEEVKNFIQKHRMLEWGDRVIVAVSGGPDSVALLHILHRLRPIIRCELHVFHLDHGLRGESSSQDALYVQTLSDNMNLEHSIVSLPPDALKRRKGSLQANARQVRIEKITALAQQIGANKVAIGHNRNDQAETILMRFLRGSGMQGLTGIQPMRKIGELTYIRPLLGIARNEIEQYCLDHELCPRSDQSNSTTDYLRNKVRLELLPQLIAGYNPALLENLTQMAEVLQEEERLIDHLAKQALSRCLLPRDGGDIALNGEMLQREPLALARRVVRLAAKEIIGPGKELGLLAVTQILEVTAKTKGTQEVCLPNGLHVEVEYGMVRFLAQAKERRTDSTSIWSISMKEPTIIPELGVRVEVTTQEAEGGSLEAVFDAGLLPGPLSLRRWRFGDRIWPKGMEGSMKLQDIFVNDKIPLRLRSRIPILVSGNEVIWIVGHRLDRRFLATPRTEGPLLVRVVIDPIDSRLKELWDATSAN